MSQKLQDRLGVFAIPTSAQDSLIAEAQRVYRALHDDPGDRWYELRHDLFEHLLRDAVVYRILTSDTAEESFVRFVRAVGMRKTWDEASPKRRMELAREHLPKVNDPELRAALDEVSAHPGDLGLWIETESALPSEPESATHEHEVDAEEVARKLDRYLNEQAWKDLTRKRRT